MRLPVAWVAVEAAGGRRKMDMEGEREREEDEMKKTCAPLSLLAFTRDEGRFILGVYSYVLLTQDV